MQGVEEERGKSQNKRGRQRGRAGQGKVTPHGRAGERNSLNEAFGETWSCVRPTQDRKKGVTFSSILRPSAEVNLMKTGVLGLVGSKPFVAMLLHKL